MAVHCGSKIKALEDKVRTIKVLAYSRIQEQNPYYRKTMGEGLDKVTNAETATQRTANIKKHRLIASTDNLNKFLAMLARNNLPGQCAHTTYTLQNKSQSKVTTSKDRSGSKHKETPHIVCRQVDDVLGSEKKASCKACFNVVKKTSLGGKTLP